MLRKITDGVEHIYLAVGATDFRKQIPGLTALVQSRFQLDPYSPACLFLQGIAIDQKHTLHSVDITPENACF